VIGFSLAPGQVLLNQHLPFLIPVLRLITSPDYVLSFYKWNMLMTLLYMVSLSLLGQVLLQSGLDKYLIRSLSAGAVLFYPYFFSLLNGQDTAVLVLGTAVWVSSMLRGKEFFAGLGLSLATVRPHIILLIAVPMFFRHRQAFWGVLLGSAILALISFMVTGPEGTQDFIRVLRISAEGTWYGLNEHAMFNLIGLLLRLLPGVDIRTSHLIGWTAYSIALVGLCLLWAQSQEIRDGRVGLTLTISLFVAPHLHFHDLALLVIPIYEWVRMSKDNEKIKTSIAIAAPIAVSLVFLANSLTPYLQYTTPYLVMLVLAIYPYYCRFPTPFTTPHRS
jgi:hypothetical protein